MNFSNLYFLFGSNFIFGLFISEKIMLFNILVTKLSIDAVGISKIFPIFCFGFISSFEFLFSVELSLLSFIIFIKGTFIFFRSDSFGMSSSVFVFSSSVIKFSSFSGFSIIL